MLGAALLTLLLLAATANVGLRTRSVLVAAERLERIGKERELRWLAGVRRELSLATAIARTATSLALVLDVFAICEGFGLARTERYCVAFGATFGLVLIFGVAVPAALVKYAAGAVIATALPIYRPLHVVALPLLRSLRAVDSIVRRIVGAPAPTPESEADDLEKDILNVVSEGELQGAVDEQETEMIRSVMEFADTDVEEIMTPRTDIVAIDRNTSLERAKKVIAESGHSRIPVYDESIDNILGVLYAKDLLLIDTGEQFDVTETMRSVPYIPDNKPVDDLLQELKDRKVHMAIVLDEYGGTSGLVTIEDIIEELVGEIVDEYEPAESAVLERIDEHTVEVDGRMRIDDLNQELSIALPENDDYETIGGYVFSSLGKIPQVGEQCRHDNVQITVLAAEPRRINRLRVQIDADVDGDISCNGK